jgi:hypothetical protein
MEVGNVLFKLVPEVPGAGRFEGQERREIRI